MSKSVAKKSTNKNTADISHGGANKIGLGIGLTAAAVAAAGAYFLYGSDGASKNRKQVKSWMLKAKADILEQLEDSKKMSRDEFQAIVASVAAAYTGAKSVTKKDVSSFAAEMMQHWESLETMITNQKTAKPKSKTPTKAKSTTAKSTPKKSPAKTTRTKLATKKSTK